MFHIDVFLNNYHDYTTLKNGTDIRLILNYFLNIFKHFLIVNFYFV